MVSSGPTGRDHAHQPTGEPQFGLNISNLNQSSIYGAQDDQQMVNHEANPIDQSPLIPKSYHASKHGGRSLSGPPDLRDQQYLKTYNTGACLPPYANIC